MGIDVYLHKHGESEPYIYSQEKEGFMWGVWNGEHGYLREAYHGGPYATKELLPECWKDGYEGELIPIKSSVLKKRLDIVVDTSRERSTILYKEDPEDTDKTAQSFIDFVELASRLEKESGYPCKFYASY